MTSTDFTFMCIFFLFLTFGQVYTISKIDAVGHSIDGLAQQLVQL